MVAVDNFASLLKEHMSLAVQSVIRHSMFRKALTFYGQGVRKIVTKFRLPLRRISITSAPLAIPSFSQKCFVAISCRPLRTEPL